MASTPDSSPTKHRIAIIGGGPGGNEAALAGAQLGADVTLIERTGVGGSATLTDVVPSKTLIAAAEAASTFRSADELGVNFFVNDDHDKPVKPDIVVNFTKLNQRIRTLAQQQSDDYRHVLEEAGVKVIEGEGRLDGPNAVLISSGKGGKDFDRIEADTIVVSVGASPRVLDSARPDGERILTWKQLYTLTEVPDHLIVVGSGVTGAEFASAYRLLGCEVTLVSSRDRVLPGEDPDAADVIEEVFRRNGMNVISGQRAEKVVRDGDEVVATLSDGREVRGSHCLMAVGSTPNTEGLGLEEAGVQLADSGHIIVNSVARTSVPNVYAAGDCTNFFPLASVAAQQGRAAVFHALGDEVRPINLRNVASNVFTYPEIATVGWQQKSIEEGAREGRIQKIDLKHNARAKMQGFRDGFVKIITGRDQGIIIGAVVVAPRASELILPLSIAIEQRLTVDQFARGWAAYPSLSSSVVDLARSMHVPQSTFTR